MTAKDDMLQLAWIFVGMGVGIWLVLYVRETAFQSYYKGRKDGWNMHRRMIDTKRKSDEVFDYDKQG